MPMAADTETTGTSIDRAMRSAVRCRVPVSVVGTVGFGMRWTLARAMRAASAETMMAPSILASSDSRWGLNSASRRNPPVQMDSTSASSPTTISAPRLASSTRSRPVAQRLTRVPPAPGHRPWPSPVRLHGRMVPGHRRLPTAPPPVPGGAAAAVRGGSMARPRRPPRATECTWTTSIPAGPSGHDAGTRARRKPTRAASASRRGAWGTWRISPPRPTSPKATTSAGRARPASGRGQGQGQGQVGGGLGHPDAAHGRGEDVGAGQGDAGTLLENGQQQRQPPAVDPLGRTPGRGRRSCWRPARAWISTSSARCPSTAGSTALPGVPGPPVAEQEPVGIGHRRQAGVAHLEETELAGGPEPVLGRPHQAQGVVPVSFDASAPCRPGARAPGGRPGPRPW